MEECLPSLPRRRRRRSQIATKTHFTFLPLNRPLFPDEVEALELEKLSQTTLNACLFRRHSSCRFRRRHHGPQGTSPSIHPPLLQAMTCRVIRNTNSSFAARWNVWAEERTKFFSMCSFVRLAAQPTVRHLGVR